MTSQLHEGAVTIDGYTETIAWEVDKLMGAVKRVIYNEQLMIATHYNNDRSLKMLLRNLAGLEKLAEKGDQVATAIMVDLKNALGMYRRQDSTLSDKQLQIVKLNLVHGIPQEEIAEMLGLTQHTIYHHLNGGLKRLKKQLCGGGHVDDE